jgi:hypothetical protein
MWQQARAVVGARREQRGARSEPIKSRVVQLRAGGRGLPLSRISTGQEHAPVGEQGGRTAGARRPHGRPRREPTSSWVEYLSVACCFEPATTGQRAASGEQKPPVLEGGGVVNGERLQQLQ